MKNELYLILKPKSEKVRASDILEKIIRHEDFNLNDYDVSYANTLNQFLHNYQKEVTDFIIDKRFSNLVNTQILNEVCHSVSSP